MAKEIVGLVAVRTESTRLPGKAFRPLAGKPLLEVLVDRLLATKELDDFIICATVNPSDDKVEEFCLTKKVKCYRGEVKNVLDRFLGATSLVPSEYVVRITGDNPLTDFLTMRECFDYMKANQGDYSRQMGVPLGTACEVIRTEALRELSRRTLSHDLTEYMTYFFEMAPFIKNTLYEVKPEHRFPELRLTVDYESDLIFIQKIFDHFGRAPSLQEVVAYCKTLTEYPRVVNDPVAAAEIKNQIKFK
ncbi:MAG: hypothetical protein KKC80_05640 [Candidatus Margulisbacteria bacterium]|nr:hypothetical protein [Candidatus Margulisiibacteriota bacterium]